ncbi:MAG: DUF1818 family protein [Cyanobacteria bacterium J06614_10]
MLRQLLSGEGWRLGWDPNAEQFYGLLGGEHWSLELTAVEFQDFCTAVRSLQRAMAAMAEQLMAEERLTCEKETETVWLEAEGFPAEYSLRFMLLTGRRGEGEWPAAAIPGLLSAVEKAVEQLPL